MTFLRKTAALVAAAAVAPAAALSLNKNNREAAVSFSVSGLDIYHNGQLVSGADSSVEETLGVDFASDSNGGSSNTLSPAERQAAHASTFEKEFVVKINLTQAFKEGKTMGVALDVDTDFTPVSVLSIKKTGLLEAWNKANPDKAVFVGDEIYKVNAILWHHNTRTFVERIKGQFQAGKAQLPGAKEILELSVSRPRKESAKRYASQREDLHRQLYSAEFVVEIPFTGILPHEPLHQAMGWKLNSSVEWMPVSIEKLRDNGLIAMYNEEHPETKIKSGDEIMQVNHVQFHHNATLFQDRLLKQFNAGRTMEFSRAPGSKNVMTLHIRRPRSAKDHPEDQIYKKSFFVTLALTDDTPLHWQLNDTVDAAPVTVHEVGDHGPIHDHNVANPKTAIKAGDIILRVNGFPWHGNSLKFSERLQKEFEQSHPSDGMPATKPLELLMQRKVVQPIMREWLVTLPALEGKVLGWQLNVTADEFPVTVSKVRSGSLLAYYNQRHPESAIRPRDIIVKVNDLLWEENSILFEKRLQDMYFKARKEGNITFFMRRPEGPEDPPATPENSAFYKEYIVELPFTNGQPAGWQLKTINETSPVVIDKVRSDKGAVLQWNNDNPLDPIMAGDQIRKVNGVIFRGNSTMFLERINKNVAMARGGANGKWTVELLVQRPWKLVNKDANKDAQGAASKEDEGDEEPVIGAEEDANKDAQGAASKEDEGDAEPVIGAEEDESSAS